MVGLDNIPTELLPLIIQNVARPSHLSVLCLVNRSFYVFAAELLYRAVYIYSWQKDSKTKVIKLLRTLAACPQLAAHVYHLTVRDFPRALYAAEREEIFDIRLRAIQNCVNLRSCAWTRDGSLNTDVLDVLSRAENLCELELNGRNEWRYDAYKLCDFNHLCKITLIMPSTSVTSVLPTWTASTVASLRHLVLICRSSTVVNDHVLEDIAPNLINLEKFYVVGCPKVTHAGIISVLSHIRSGVRGLGLEGLASTFDMAQFSEHCRNTSALRLLRSITLSIDSKTLLSAWPDEVSNMLLESPLEEFHISSNGGEVGLDISAEFCADIAATHSGTLRRFSVHRLRMNLRTVKEICQLCPELIQLFVTMEQDDLDGFGKCLAIGKNLRSVHVHRPMGPLETDDIPVVSQDRIMALIKQSNWALKRIGFNTRVHQIERIHVKNPDGSFHINLRLVPLESPEIPEQFLVVRT